jgi:hypothetical protein
MSANSTAMALRDFGWLHLADGFGDFDIVAAAKHSVNSPCYALIDLKKVEKAAT